MPWIKPTKPAYSGYCRHCQQQRPHRSRGLCWLCFETPDIRRQYQPLTTAGRRGVGLVASPYHGPPTVHAPGTPEKCLIIRFRAALGYPLFHSLDAMYHDDPTPHAAGVVLRARLEPAELEQLYRETLDQHTPGKVRCGAVTFNTRDHRGRETGHIFLSARSSRRRNSVLSKKTG